MRSGWFHASALLAAWLAAPFVAHAAADLDWPRLRQADSEPQNWLTLGRDY
jgi:hypothetical protein